MLNCSTADEYTLDPTVSGCLKRASLWGFEGLLVVNMFGFRSPYPKDLLTVEDPVGDENDSYIQFAAGIASSIVVGWGNSAPVRSLILARQPRMVELLGNDVGALGINKDGTPKHPLYVAHSIHPSPWKPPIPAK